ASSIFTCWITVQLFSIGTHETPGAVTNTVPESFQDEGFLPVDKHRIQLSICLGCSTDPTGGRRLMCHYRPDVL
ncbi:unnamed protein product, partial [Tenebrio molitor]